MFGSSGASRALGLSTSSWLAGLVAAVALTVGSLGPAHAAPPGSPPTFRSQNSATFTVGIVGSFSIFANGSPAPTFSITSASPPAWLSVQCRERTAQRNPADRDAGRSHHDHAEGRERHPPGRDPDVHDQREQSQVIPISWDVIGLDSNNQTVGPNQFVCGARVINRGAATTSNLAVTLVFQGKRGQERA